MPSDQNRDDRANLRVLVVDDDGDMVRVVRYVLRQMGITQIQSANDGNQALEMLTKGPDHFDLIICDWVMPSLSGLDVLTGLRSMNTRVPFLMLTAKANPDAIMAAKKAGVTSYIVKPFTPMELTRKIELLIDKPVTRPTQDQS